MVKTNIEQTQPDLYMKTNTYIFQYTDFSSVNSILCYYKSKQLVVFLKSHSMDFSDPNI